MLFKKHMNILLIILVLFLQSGCRNEDIKDNPFEVVTAAETSEETETEKEIASATKTEEKILSDKSLPEIYLVAADREGLREYDELFPVFNNGYFEYMDKNGNIVTDLELDNAYFFSEGMAAVCKNDLWGYIDLTGTIRIPLQYTGGGFFQKDLYLYPIVICLKIVIFQ